MFNTGRAKQNSPFIVSSWSRFMRSTWLLFLYTLFTVPLIVAPGTSQAEQEDHPLVSRFPGSEIQKFSVKEFDEYNFIEGIDHKKKEFIGKKLAGRVTRIVYSNPKERSVLEIYKNFEMALNKGGMKTLFQCTGKECGADLSVNSWSRFNGISAYTGDKSRYLAGRIESNGQQAYVSLMVGRNRTQVDVIEIKSMETGLVSVNAETLSKDIDQRGHVRIYGIYFDTGKSTIRPESKPALKEIATLLQLRKSLKLFVVGHTDSVGPLEVNMSLSNERAQAVVQNLIDKYEVAGNRLTPYGVGPLAPAASNSTEEGRSLNRRVELVKQ